MFRRFDNESEFRAPHLWLAERESPAIDWRRFRGLDLTYRGFGVPSESTDANGERLKPQSITERKE